MIPTEQHCPNCGDMFIGSDVIGGLCPYCEMFEPIVVIIPETGFYTINDVTKHFNAGDRVEIDYRGFRKEDQIDDN